MNANIKSNKSFYRKTEIHKCVYYQHIHNRLQWFLISCLNNRKYSISLAKKRRGSTKKLISLYPITTWCEMKVGHFCFIAERSKSNHSKSRFKQQQLWFLYDSFTYNAVQSEIHPSKKTWQKLRWVCCCCAPQLWGQVLNALCVDNSLMCLQHILLLSF